MLKKFFVLQSTVNKSTQEVQEEYQEVETALRVIYGSNIEVISTVKELPELLNANNYVLLLANKNIELMAQTDMVVCARGYMNDRIAYNYKLIANMYGVPVWEMAGVDSGIAKCYV